MVFPEFLKENDLIEVPAPSCGGGNELDNRRINNAKSKLEKLGYKIKLSKNAFTNEIARSAPAKVRADEINKMFESNSKLMLCLEGGEFLVEMLPFVDFDKLVKNPKWVEGFSDPTGLIFPITTKYDIATIYGNNFKSFGMEDYHKSLNENLEILKGNIIEQESYELYENERIDRVTGLEGYNLSEKVYWKTLDGKPVDVSGRIIVGCIDLIRELAGTKYDGMNEFNERYKDDGIILGFDNCELSKEDLIRTLWRFNELDYFKYAKCIIFGRNGLDKTFFEEYNDMRKCLQDSVLSNLDIPIIYDADLSHKGPCLDIINGAIANIKCKDGKGKINFKLDT